MSAYARVPLGEVCTINPRIKRSEIPEKDTLVSFVPMAAVDERFGMITACEDRRLGEVSRGFTAFEDGDVLFAKITPCMENGKAALARHLTNGVGRGSTEFYVLRPDSKVLGEYIYHFIRQPQFREKAKRYFTGTAGQQRVPKSFMENISIPLPPIDKQQRIVDMLNRSAHIERLHARAAAHLHEFVSAFFIKMFGDVGQIDIRFPCAPLREVATIGSGATKGRKIDPVNAIEVPYLRVANVQDGFLDLTEIKTITIKSNEKEKYALASGDLVMTEGGDADKLGRAAIWNDDLDYCAYQNHIFRIRPHTDIILSDYLRETVGSTYGKAYFLSVAKQTTGIASVNKTQLGNFLVPIPPIDLQIRYAEAIAKFRSINTIFETTTKTASVLNISLMTRLLGDFP